MKRFWIVLLSLGMIAAFSTSALAVDVKFNGSYYLQGWYNQNASLLDKDWSGGPAWSTRGRASDAFYTSKSSIGAQFEIVKGFTFTTDFVGLDGIVTKQRKSPPPFIAKMCKANCWRRHFLQTSRRLCTRITAAALKPVRLSPMKKKSIYR